MCGGPRADGLCPWLMTISGHTGVSSAVPAEEMALLTGGWHRLGGTSPAAFELPGTAKKNIQRGSF